MQDPDGSLKMLNPADIANAPKNKIVQEGQVFKIRHTYFVITEINSSGIVAKGISRREYFERRVF